MGPRPMGPAVNAHILESAKRLWGRLNHRTY